MTPKEQARVIGDALVAAADAERAIRLEVRPARESDLSAIAEMLDDFAKGHPAEKHPRSLARLREAYFGDAPVAHLLVAVRDGQPVGMAQWTKIYEMFSIGRVE